jgi:hypothetical protein
MEPIEPNFEKYKIIFYMTEYFCMDGRVWNNIELHCLCGTEAVSIQIKLQKMQFNLKFV